MPRYEILPNGYLKLTLDTEEIAEAKENEITTIEDLLESMIANSELSWINPSDTGDLTEAPMLGIIGNEQIPTGERPGLINVGFWEETPWCSPILKRWAWMSYAVSDLLETLLEKGEAILEGGTLVEEEAVKKIMEESNASYQETRIKYRRYSLPEDDAGNTITPEEFEKIIREIGSIFRFAFTRDDNGIPLGMKLETPRDKNMGGYFLCIEEKRMPKSEEVRNQLSKFLEGYLANRSWSNEKRSYEISDLFRTFSNICGQFEIFLIESPSNHYRPEPPAGFIAFRSSRRRVFVKPEYRNSFPKNLEELIASGDATSIDL